MSFAARLAAAVAARGPTCVGLDPHLPLVLAQVRPSLPDRGDPAWRGAVAAVVRDWSLRVVEAVSPHCAAIKPQVAFYEALGSAGVAALEVAVSAARAAGLIVVLDAKRGDIGSTAEAYAAATLDDDGPLAADAVTLSPWLGPESLAPFLARTPQKGLFLLVRTSNPGADRWQEGPSGVAGRVAAWITEQNGRTPGLWGPVGAVVGATLPGEGVAWRAALPGAWLLVPGYGAQGGSLEEIRALAGPLRGGSHGVLVNNSRAVLFAGAGATDGADWPSAVRARAAAFARDLGALDG